MCNIHTKLLASLFACLLLPAVQAAPIYKWVDEQGTQHFSSEPPASMDAQKISVQTPRSPSQPVSAPVPSAKTDDAPSQQDIDQQVRKQVAQENEELKQQCTRLRTNLSQLKNNPRLLAEIDGQTVRLSEEQRQERIRETEEQIRQFCE